MRNYKIRATWIALTLSLLAFTGAAVHAEDSILTKPVKCHCSQWETTADGHKMCVAQVCN